MYYNNMCYNNYIVIIVIVIGMSEVHTTILCTVPVPIIVVSKPQTVLIITLCNIVFHIRFL